MGLDLFEFQIRIYIYIFICRGICGIWLVWVAQFPFKSFPQLRPTKNFARAGERDLASDSKDGRRLCCLGCPGMVLRQCHASATLLHPSANTLNTQSNVMEKPQVSGEGMRR